MSKLLRVAVAFVAATIIFLGNTIQSLAHPLVPGFERFHSKQPAADAGQLLLGELNCTACHAADKTAAQSLLNRQSPLLEGVGNRAKPEYLRRFVADPAAVKPGTLMPHVAVGRTSRETQDAIEALVHFLVGEDRVTETRPESRFAAKGRTLFHETGCAVCHGSQDDGAAKIPGAVPLGKLSDKYGIPGLVGFLRDPLRIRPAGRMPGLSLKDEEARDIAHYLLRDGSFDVRTNMAFRYLEGNYESLPNFTTPKLKPKNAGEAAGFDLGVALRPNDFAIEFSGFLKIERDGEYEFFLLSDDGSKLWIDGAEVVKNDGVHAPLEVAGKAKLAAGMHKLAVWFFNAGGGAELNVDYQGPGISRRPIDSAVFLTDKPPVASPKNDDPKENYAYSPALAAKGKELFVSQGCAGCHELNSENQPLKSTLAAKPLAELKPGAGCLSLQPAAPAVNYRLNDEQRTAIEAALQVLRDKPPPRTDKDRIARAMTAFNCYACHQRDGVGGVEDDRNAFFKTTQPEMGDEGVPPHLTGVGAKITTDWLRKILANGAKDRSYMKTRMPRFGLDNVGQLAAALAHVDTLEPVAAVHFNQPLRKVKSDGRHLVGGQAFGCIKCHNFKGIEATGVQSLDLTTMTERLNRDWFHRYMLNPQAFRPGTRMPSAWPQGQVTLKGMLEGDASKQIEGIWLFLSDGAKAAEPYGLGREPMPLVPTTEPIVYRNFIAGAGPRGIAVGYPERVNLAFDANNMNLALIWQGGFIDASRHWTGRGNGFQPPLGDNVLPLVSGPPFAVLADTSKPWPTQPSRDLGYQFRGYSLSDQRRPSFEYKFHGLNIVDIPIPIAGQPFSSFKREILIEAELPVENLYFRAATGDKIATAGNGEFEIDGEWTLKLHSQAPPLVRQNAGKTELLVPIRFSNGQDEIVEHFHW